MTSRSSKIGAAASSHAAGAAPGVSRNPIHGAPASLNRHCASTCSAELRAPVSTLARRRAMPSVRQRQPLPPAKHDHSVDPAAWKKRRRIRDARRAIVRAFGWAHGTGAGEGNRTLVSSLGSYSSTIELRPRRGESMTPRRDVAISAGTGRGWRPVSAAHHQKLLPIVMNALASFPSRCAAVALTPKLASIPHICVRAPSTTVA